jgi:hypothetical protein
MVMKARHWMVALTAVSLGLPGPASAAQGDPEVIIYRFPGLKDDGGPQFLGVATVFFCTNFSGVTETIRFVTRNFDGILRQNSTLSIPHLQTWSVGTHPTAAYSNDLSLARVKLVRALRQLPRPQRTSSVRR